MSLAIPSDLSLGGVVTLERGGERHSGDDANNQTDCKTGLEPHAVTVAMTRGNCTRKES